AGSFSSAPPPAGAVLLYQRAAARHLLGDRPADLDIELLGSVSIVERDGRRAAVAHGFGIGAPAAAAVAECLIAWGVRSIVSIGLAGALQADARIGDVVL